MLTLDNLYTFDGGERAPISARWCASFAHMVRHPRTQKLVLEWLPLVFRGPTEEAVRAAAQRLLDEEAAKQAAEDERIARRSEARRNKDAEAQP